jgi:hypothetical protein
VNRHNRLDRQNCTGDRKNDQRTAGREHRIRYGRQKATEDNNNERAVSGVGNQVSPSTGQGGIGHWWILYRLRVVAATVSEQSVA